MWMPFFLDFLAKQGQSHLLAFWLEVGMSVTCISYTRVQTHTHTCIHVHVLYVHAEAWTYIYMYL
jgi:hypothetical protein